MFARVRLSSESLEVEAISVCFCGFCLVVDEGGRLVVGSGSCLVVDEISWRLMADVRATDYG